MLSESILGYGGQSHREPELRVAQGLTNKTLLIGIGIYFWMIHATRQSLIRNLICELAS